MDATKTITDADCRNSTVFWFVRLEKARERQDHEAAAEAIRELLRLGINLRFAPLRGHTMIVATNNGTPKLLLTLPEAAEA